jgi:hypothetical protein
MLVRPDGFVEMREGIELVAVVLQFGLDLPDW